MALPVRPLPLIPHQLKHMEGVLTVRIFHAGLPLEYVIGVLKLSKGALDTAA